MMVEVVVMAVAVAVAVISKAGMIAARSMVMVMVVVAVMMVVTMMVVIVIITAEKIGARTLVVGVILLGNVVAINPTLMLSLTPTLIYYHLL